MKQYIIVLIVFLLVHNLHCEYNETTVKLARSFSKDIFDLNGVPYLQPMVEVVNATSNSRFFNQAYVPAKVNKPYFRVGFHNMLGFTPDSKKSYAPKLPAEKYDPDKAAKFLYSPNGLDTAGLLNYFFKNVLYDGLTTGAIPKEPDAAATVLGYKPNVKFFFSQDSLRKLVQNHPLYPYIPAEFRQTILDAISNFPETFSLAEGANINTIYAFVPQFEIGSLWGTELLVRFVPPVYLGENIGDFAFWGLGLKHSISQYFYKNENDRPFDLAIQAVYQGTHLENKIGVTQAQLKANASMFDVNIQASKYFEGLFDIYTGISFEYIDIDAQYKYTLPVEQQWQLGLLRTSASPPEPPEFPGDTKPQYANIAIDDFNVKWVVGIAKQIGPIAIFADFNLSKFSIFTGGIEYRF